MWKDHLNNHYSHSVLLVEDLQEHAELTRIVLEKAGHQVQIVPSAAAALAYLHNHDIDVILMDIVIENGNGILLCQQLRAESRFAQIPIIFLTSATDIENKIFGFQAGGDDYLTKPYNPQELLVRIELVLQKQKLRESENRYRNFVENLSDLVFMLDHQSKIVNMNCSVTELLGHSQARLQGKSVDRFIEKNFRKNFRQAFRQILDGAKIHGLYLRLIGKAAKSVPVEVNGFCWHRENGDNQVQMIMHNISERELLQQEIQRYTQLLEKQVEVRTHELNETQNRLIMSEKMASVGQLAAGIAHELRNPLSIIGTAVYYLTRILKDSANQKVKEHLEIIQSEIVRSQKIITNLLDFSRRSSAERESADINKIIRQTLSLIERDLANHDITLELDLCPLPLCFVNVDEMKQAFLNLLMNAKDAMVNGGVLSIRTYLYDKQSLVVEIHDTGIGIDAAHLEKIFDPFFSTKGDHNGVGLGLSLVHSSIQRNRGKIQVES